MRMYEREQEFLRTTLKKAYEIYCEESITVSEKAAFDIVTNVDKAIETYFSREVKKTFPEDILHSEEFHKEVSLRDRTWIFDPIDGTFNFAAGSPLFGLQAAFWDQGELQISAIYLPCLSEFYEAKRGFGAKCNGKRLFVSKREVPLSVFAFGDMPHARPDDTRLQQRIMLTAQEKIAKMRMFGAACFDFAFLASGRTEGVLLMTQNKWDIAPGYLLAKEAGAFVRGLEGEEYSFQSRGIFACNQPELYYELMEGLLK